MPVPPGRDTLPHDVPGQHIALAQAYDGSTRVVGRLDEADLQRPTRCRGGRPAQRRAVRPAGRDDAEYLLKAAGRLPLIDRDRRDLGEAAGWFPLLG